MTRKRVRPKPDKKKLIIRRLSTYLRTLDHLRNKGVEVISSSDLERIEGVTQSLIRRDLAEVRAHLGEPGAAARVAEHLIARMDQNRQRRRMRSACSGYRPSKSAQRANVTMSGA